MAMKIDLMIRGWPQAEIDGKWYLVKPYIKPLRWRIKDAWGVLTGRYGAHSYESEERKRKAGRIER